MASWSEVVDFSQALAISPGGNDRVETFRVMSDVRVIIFDREIQRRRVVPMRWGYPKPGNWRVPQPIHARSEAIDTTHPHKYGFLAGQRGIVLAKTFNEAPDVPARVSSTSSRLAMQRRSGSRSHGTDFGSKSWRRRCLRALWSQCRPMLSSRRCQPTECPPFSPMATGRHGS